MRFSLLASSVLACAISVGSLHAADLASPESVVAAPVKAMRSNDMLALFKSMPAEEQAKARQEWKDKATTISPTERAELDEKLSMLLDPKAVDNLMAMIEPQLKQVNPQELAGMLQMFGGIAAMQLAQQPAFATTGKSLQTLAMDLAAWLPTSGIEDPAKMRLAITSVVNAAKAFRVANADELLKLDLDEFLTRGGAALKEAKNAFKPYDIEFDAFLDSIALINVKGTGDKRTGDLKLTAFAHDITFPVPLVQKDGKWQIDEQEMQKAVAPLMGGMGMGGGGAGEL